jgi:hypothetical protein
MASNKAVAELLAYLQELFPSRDVTEKTLPVWVLHFEDWSDEELRACTRAAAREPGRKFFPTPGEIAAHRAPAPAIDADAILERIAKLGYHNPRSGWMYPTAQFVREQLGDVIANAYVTAGGERCFASPAGDGSTVGRDIARRTFAEEIRTAHSRAPGGLQLIPPAPAPTLELRSEDVRHRLPASTDPRPAANLRAKLPPIDRPQSQRGRVALGAAFRVARSKAIAAWTQRSPDNAAKYDELAATIPRDYSLAARQARVEELCAPFAGFPEFDAWCESQGFLPSPSRVGATHDR